MVRRNKSFVWGGVTSAVLLAGGIAAGDILSMILSTSVGLSAAAADQLSGKWVIAAFSAAGIIELGLSGDA